MANALKVLVVDNDPDTLAMVTRILVQAGFDVRSLDDGHAAIEEVRRNPPDCALIDLMMPRMDGLTLCRELRRIPGFENGRIVMMSAKIYDADRAAASRVGADAYLLKPFRVAKLLELLHEVMDDRIRVDFFGVRGTLPASGPDKTRYGGHTSCLMARFPKGGLFVLDAGTGIRSAGAALLAEGTQRLTGTILITHPHWDHLNALPFFSPLYTPGNQFHVYGPAQHGHTMAELVSAQMDGTFFPITPREFGAAVHFTDMAQGTHNFDGVVVEAMLLMHPGHCLGYRLRYGGRSLCYITDNELYLPDSDNYSREYVTRLADFVRGAEVLVTDTTYTDEEYKSRVGWGHSCVSQVADLAARAEVKQLCLFHHDPDQNDEAIDRKLETMQELLHSFGSKVEATAPVQGTELLL